MIIFHFPYVNNEYTHSIYFLLYIFQLQNLVCLFCDWAKDKKKRFIISILIVFIESFIQIWDLQRYETLLIYYGLFAAFILCCCLNI